MEIGNAVDRLRGHGGHHRQAEAKRSDQPLTLAKREVGATRVERGGVEDGLERAGHDAKLCAIHPKLLWLCKGC